jgi:beta-glucuronidase
MFGFAKVATIEQYFPVFDKLRKEFFVGELIWNFADFMTKQGLLSIYRLSISTHVKFSQLAGKLINKFYQCCYFIKLPQGCPSQLVDKLLNCRTITSCCNNL